MEEIKYQGKFIKVTEEEIENVTWERVYLSNGVQVFPITSNGKILMIEEKRPHETPPRRLKFVTGLMDGEEDPIETANREMQEEIGFKANHLEVLIHRKTTGTVNNDFYQIIATGLEESKIPNPDGEDSIISIKEYSIEEIENLLDDEKLPWSMGALGIFKLKNLIKKGKVQFE